MALSRYGQNLSYVDNATTYTGEEIAFAHGVADQASGALAALAPGVRTGWAVSIGSGLSVNIAAGEGIARHAAYGAVAMRSAGVLSAAVSASTTGYIHAVVEDDASPGGNRSVKTMMPKFVFSDLNTLANAVCLACVVSSGAAVTAVYDRRRIVPAEGELFGGMFSQDDVNTIGLTAAFHGGRIARADGGIVAVPAFTVTVAPGNNWVDLDEDGVAYLRNTSTPVAGHKNIWFAVANSTQIGTATSARDRRSSLHFGAGGVGGGADILAGSAIVVTDNLDGTKTVSLPDEAITDSKIGARSIDEALASPSGSGPVTSLFSWLAGRIKAATGAEHWYSAPATTLAAAQSHIEADAPHAGHLNANGTTPMAAPFDLGGHRAVNAATPADPTDLVNKAYADALATGLSLKASVKAATTANLVLSGEQVVDAVSLGAGDRVLVKNQTTMSENGIYTVQETAWERSPDADDGSELPAGSATFVEYGAANRLTRWVLISPGITLDTDPQIWTRDSAGAGEVNTASNVGTEGVGFYEAKAGVNLGFRNIVSKTAGALAFAYNSTTRCIEARIDSAQIAINDLLGTLAVNKGGTGLEAISRGSVLYASADNELAALEPNTGSERMSLTQAGGAAPQWAVVTGSGYNAESENALTSELAPITFTTQPGTAYLTGNRVRLIAKTSPSFWCEGVITTYSGTAMTVAIDRASVPPEDGIQVVFGGFRLSLAGEPAAEVRQLAGRFHAGPAAGEADFPEWREIEEADLPDSGITAGVYGSSYTIPVPVFNSKGIATGCSGVLPMGARRSVNQTSHGFTAGDYIRLTGSDTYAKAQADSGTNAAVCGIVYSVTSANTFNYVAPGSFINTLSGLTPGAVYYLSPTTAGGHTATDPASSGNLSRPVLYAITSGTGLLLAGHPRTLTAGEIPDISASIITSGVVPTARLGSGTADSTTFLRGDGAWATPAGGGTLVALPAGDLFLFNNAI